MSLFGGPLCCGFIKCATYEQQTSGYTLSTQHQNLKRLFSNIDVSEAVYKARGKKTVSAVGENILNTHTT